MLNAMKLYLIVKNDKYELPVFCGTAQEAAEFLGVRQDTVYMYVHRAGKKNAPRALKIESIEIVDEEDVLNINKIEYPCSVCAKWQGRKDDCTKYKRCAGWRKWFSARCKEESGTISEAIKNAKSIRDN